MEFLEGILAKFRKKEHPPQSVESPPKDISKEWDYNYFREYLLALTRGREFTLAIDQFPERIHLNGNWQTVLNDMRERTVQTGKEQWVLVGFKTDQRALYMPTVPVEGLSRAVTGEIQWKEILRAKEKFGIVSRIGDIHSHPRGSDTRFAGWQEEPAGAFSPLDLYGLLLPQYFSQMVGVVEPGLNIFALRTRDTQYLSDPRGVTPEKFTRGWLEKFGFRVHEMRDEVGKVEPFTAEPVSEEARENYDLRKISLAIAKLHKLVIYQGKPNQDLVRSYPPIK